MNALETKNRGQVMAIMQQYKTAGVTNYQALLSVKERLPKLFKDDPTRVSACIAVALFQAFEGMNLSRPMTEDQILDLTETIIDSSNDDYLAIEDVVMFLQGLTRGKYGPLYESMDIPKFMEKFSVYRAERTTALNDFREEQHAQYKALPVNDRLADMFPDDEKSEMRNAMKDYLRGRP